MSSRSLVILFPFFPTNPSGGMRIPFEYANRLAERGCAVFAVFMASASGRANLVQLFFARMVALYCLHLKKYWFPFNRRVKTSVAKSLQTVSFTHAETVLAIGWELAQQTDACPHGNANVFFLLQGWQNGKPPAGFYFHNTQVIAVAPHLKQWADSHSAHPAILVSNAVDFSLFNITNRAERPYILMPFSTNPQKGFNYAMAALQEVNSSFPVEAVLYGVEPPPEALPRWVKFIQKPTSMAELFNQSAVFIAPSESEGMPLSVMEAMACGCCCLLSNIEGHTCWNTDVETALFFESGNSLDLQTKLLYLLQNPELRTHIAAKAVENVQQFTWDKTISNLEKALFSL